MFVFVSNLTVGQPNISGRNHRVVVVEIDNLTYEREYRERSPLDRCVLEQQLAAIYAAKPQVVAIDLDLSPATWRGSGTPEEQACPKGSSAPCEADCQKRLYKMMQDQAIPKGKTDGIATVMLQPFSGEDLEARAKRLAWRDCMLNNCESDERKGSGKITFANGDIPVEYGLTLKFPRQRDSFSKMVRFMADGCERAPLTERHCHDSEWEREAFIDSRTYVNDIDVILVKDTTTAPARDPERKQLIDKQQLTDKIAESLDSLLPLHGEQAPRKVVFFGAAYGEDDRFLTPIGYLYGLEAHAGAYLRHGVDPNEIIEFLADWILATLFGVIGIGSLWERYFHARFSGNALREAAAPLFILWLILRVAAMLAGLVVLATIAFMKFNLWLSPLALAVGMLFDSLVGGAVEGAIHAHGLHRLESTKGASSRGSTHATGASPQIMLKTAFVREETHSTGQTIATAEFSEVLAGDVAAVSPPPRAREEPPVSQWINGTWRMFRWLIYAWTALDMLMSLGGG
jgi:hypothetical protein